MVKDKKQNKEYETLLSVLANGSTDKARELLKRHSGQDAINTQDLQVKLARVYALSPSKIEIEKQFAEIHPHKDFILKYLTPKAEVSTLAPDKIVVKEEITEKAHAPCGNRQCTKCNEFFNCGGDSSCSCGKISNACGGGCSSFNGYSNAGGEQTLAVQPQNQNAIIVVGLVSVVAIFGMVLYLKSNK